MDSRISNEVSKSGKKLPMSWKFLLWNWNLYTFCGTNWVPFRKVVSSIWRQRLSSFWITNHQLVNFCLQNANMGAAANWHQTLTFHNFHTISTLPGGFDSGRHTGCCFGLGFYCRFGGCCLGHRLGRICFGHSLGCHSLGRSTPNTRGLWFGGRLSWLLASLWWEILGHNLPHGPCSAVEKSDVSILWLEICQASSSWSDNSYTYKY